MIYIAVSAANACQYCLQSHTAAACTRGMTDAQHGELLTIIGLAAQTNHIALAMQVPPIRRSMSTGRKGIEKTAKV
jgi:AhpD family alkylhydroperoxidase